MIDRSILILIGLILGMSACNKDGKEVSNNPNTSQTSDWMQDLIAQYPNESITLRDIAMPRAHDAGLYELNTCTAGNACNTQTQDQLMGTMLEMGIRVFDVRPSLIQGEYWTYHRNSCGGLGCEGVRLRTFLEETRMFLATHNELVIFELNNLCNTNSQDLGLIALFQEVLGSSLYTISTPLAASFISTPLDEIIPLYNNEGRVILLFEDLDITNDITEQGMFGYDFIPISGSYSNSPDVDVVVADQLQKIQNFNPMSNRLFKLSYTFTLDIGNAVACLSNPEFASSINEIALDGRARMTSTIDAWIANGTITSDKIPNIFSVDYCNTSVTMECIRLSELSLNE